MTHLISSPFAQKNRRQTRFGDKPFKFHVFCPENGTAVLKNLEKVLILCGEGQSDTRYRYIYRITWYIYYCCSEQYCAVFAVTWCTTATTSGV